MTAGMVAGLFLLFLCIAKPVWIAANAATPAPAAGAAITDAVEPSELKDRDLLFPVPVVSASAMANSFDDHRGERVHHAVDILAPRNSEVVAVTDGTIARMMTSAAGGIAVYQFSADQRYCFYYAHLQSYARDLFEGNQVKRGQVLGYVGTTGNAPANTPHLHFAIAKVEKKNQWWGGKPVNPYPIWRQ
jgi:peptidoglycan LD-endopeptidase LytH